MNIRFITPLLLYSMRACGIKRNAKTKYGTFQTILTFVHIATVNHSEPNAWSKEDEMKGHMKKKWSISHITPKQINRNSSTNSWVLVCVYACSCMCTDIHTILNDVYIYKKMLYNLFDLCFMVFFLYSKYMCIVFVCAQVKPVFNEINNKMNHTTINIREI